MVLGQEERKVINQLKSVHDKFDANLVRKALNADIRSERLVEGSVNKIKEEKAMLNRAITHLSSIISRFAYKKTISNPALALREAIFKIRGQADSIEKNLEKVESALA